MSGHSKWANIKRKKAKVDAQKGTTFSRLTKEIMSAARRGGGNPDANFRLRLAIQKAKASNLPQSNIDRAIQRATGQVEGVHFEEAVYEGYGPGGSAILLEILTDNRNRTAGEIRHLFTRHGGSLGESGSVLWMFDQKARITVPAGRGWDEERLLEAALEAGAEDFRVPEDGEEFEILTEAEALDDVQRALAEAGAPIDTVELTRIPKTTVELDGADAERLLKLTDLLDEHDDVQKVYTNAELSEETLASLSE
jgi:YebC/PmpR family DNA-binding regulatory protein